MENIKLASSRTEDRFFDCMALAFAGDPIQRYMWPDASLFLKAFVRFAKPYCGPAINDGTAWYASDFSGCAAWLRPGRSADVDLVTELFTQTCVPERIDEVNEMYTKVTDLKPSEPHWYLPMIGVDPGHQNKGIGSQLLLHGLNVVDEDPMPVFLESSNPLNVPLYQRFGFEPLDVFDLDGRPLMTPMLRPKM